MAGVKGRSGMLCHHDGRSLYRRKRVAVNVRIHEAAREALFQLAQAEGVGMGHLIQGMIEERLQAQGLELRDPRFTVSRRDRQQVGPGD